MVASNRRKLFSHCSGGQKSKIKVLAGPHSLWRLQGRNLPYLFQHLMAPRKSLALLGLCLHHPNSHLCPYRALCVSWV